MFQNRLVVVPSFILFSIYFIFPIRNRSVTCLFYSRFPYVCIMGHDLWLSFSPSTFANIRYWNYWMLGPWGWCIIGWIIIIWALLLSKWNIHTKSWRAMLERNLLSSFAVLSPLLEDNISCYPFVLC